MVPTLAGRIQTRVFLLALIGSIITAIITPLLPVDGPLSDRYQTTFIVLAAVAVLGIGWELIYHVLMQWRWEKDWPTLFGLLTLLPEGVLVGALAVLGALPLLPASVPAWAFVVHFTAVWIAVWLFANGPMRTPFIRWRFRGGRLV
jgi:heme/copper-type cytochrome/quinol oxidase subunit 4